MSRERAVIGYLLAIAAYRKWFENGVITDSEFFKIELHAAERYGLPKSSIYR
jgi:hypothetical protein